MAEVSKKLYNATLGDSNATLYTVPAATKTIVKSITLCNRTAAAATATIELDGIYIINGHSIAARDSIIIPNVDQILDTGDLIEGLAGTASAIDCCISGIEVT